MPGGSVLAQHATGVSWRDSLVAAASLLAGGGVEAPRFEAEYLLLEVLEVSKTELFLHDERVLSSEKGLIYQEMIRRRLRQEPLQYIVGKTEFWSRDFRVTPEVLIPRQETEFVLEKILAHIRSHSLPCKKILDMGTGSGVLADVLAGELPCQVLAVDCSPGALVVAQENISSHHLEDRVTFLCSDLFSGISRSAQFDLIVSNPPYVAEAERKDLHPQVLDYEPELALFAGSDGLNCYRRLVPQSFAYLRPGGWLCLEIGAGQGGAIGELLLSHGYQEISIFADYADRPRLAMGKKDDSSGFPSTTQPVTKNIG